STRQVRLTGEGEQLLAAARAVLEKWDDAMLVAASIRPPENARIALGISLRMHSGIRVDIQNRLAELGAAVTIDFTAGSTPRLIDQVEAGRLDAAVCLTPAPRPGLRS